MKYEDNFLKRVFLNCLTKLPYKHNKRPGGRISRAFPICMKQMYTIPFVVNYIIHPQTGFVKSYAQEFIPISIAL